MKKLTIYLAFLAMVSFTSFSCSDKCDDAKCENGATCTDGTCNCAQGYEGTKCATASRDKFIGTWIGAYKSAFKGTGLDTTVTMADTIVFTAGSSKSTLNMKGYTGEITPSGNTIKVKITDNSIPGSTFEIPEANFTLNGSNLTLTKSNCTGKMGPISFTGTSEGTWLKK